MSRSAEDAYLSGFLGRQQGTGHVNTEKLEMYWRLSKYALLCAQCDRAGMKARSVFLQRCYAMKLLEYIIGIRKAQREIRELTVPHPTVW